MNTEYVLKTALELADAQRMVQGFRTKPYGGKAVPFTGERNT